MYHGWGGSPESECKLGLWWALQLIQLPVRTVKMEQEATSMVKAGSADNKWSSPLCLRPAPPEAHSETRILVQAGVFFGQ